MKNADNTPSTGVNKGISKAYVVCGVIIALCAIAEFIIWIVDTSRIHMNNELIMGCGFLALSVGVLLYLLLRNKSYRGSNAVLWFFIIASIALMFVGICVTPEHAEAIRQITATMPQ